MRSDFVARAAFGAAFVLSASLVIAAATAQPRSPFVQQRVLDVEAPWGTEKVLVTWPRRTDGRDFAPGSSMPIVVALHGRAEAIAGRDRGHLAWNDYGLPEAFGALARRRLEPADFASHVRADHLRYVNHSLARAPFRGVMVVTPYTPDLSTAPHGGSAIGNFAAWLAGPLLRTVRQQFPAAAQTRDGTGIDGVSLGGMLALEVGFLYPGTFGTIGAIQPAIYGREGVLAQTAAENRVSRSHVRLVTSDDDTFLEPTRELSSRLRRLRVAHSLAIYPGPHDATFNQGPGAIELLLFHDRALSHTPATP